MTQNSSIEQISCNLKLVSTFGKKLLLLDNVMLNAFIKIEVFSTTRDLTFLSLLRHNLLRLALVFVSVVDIIMVYFKRHSLHARLTG